MQGVNPNKAPTALELRKRDRHIDGGAIGQRHHRTDTGDRHHVADDGQQAAVEDGELFAQNPPHYKEWFNQTRQIRKILDQLPDAGLEPRCSDHAHLEAEVAQGATQIVLDGDRLRLQQLAMRQQHPQLLTA